MQLEEKCERITHQCLRQECPRITFPFAKNVIPLPFISLVQPEEHPPEVELLDKAFANMIPHHPMTMGTGGAEGRPIAIIEEDFQAAFLGKLARLNVEDDDAGLYDGGSKNSAQKSTAITYDV